MISNNEQAGDSQETQEILQDVQELQQGIENIEIQVKDNENQENINDQNNQEELMDFNQLFKSAKVMKPKLNRKQEEPKLYQNVVPRNLTITQELMAEKRCLDLRRWYCLSRAQYQRSCGISSVTTVWNYLFSTLGVGQLNPISQEEAIISLGLAQEFGPTFNDVEFGAFSGNMSLIRWFKDLCRIHKVQGRSYYLWKNEGDHSTPGVDRDLALEKMKQGLKSDKVGYIYHAYDHYFCPIGFEITSNKQIEAYSVEFDLNDAVHWIIIAEPAKPHPFFTVRKWTDIATDIELPYPQYTNIRKMEEGIKEYKNPMKNGASQHCIMCFERIEKKVKQPKKENIKIDVQEQEVA